MREVNARYEVDGLYANGWPNWNMPVCYCDVCRKLPKSGTMEYQERFMERAIEIWTLYDKIAKEKSPDNLFFGNLGGGFRTGLDLKRLAEKCDWFNADNQGRTGACACLGRPNRARRPVGHEVKTITTVHRRNGPRQSDGAQRGQDPAEAEI